jgi:hypothetical protein
LLGLFVKLAFETPRATFSGGSAAPKLRLFLALWFVLSSLAVTPLAGTAWMAASSDGLTHGLFDLRNFLAGEPMSRGTIGLGALCWGVSAALAAWLISIGRVFDRIPADRDGVGLMTAGLCLLALVTLPLLGLRNDGPVGKALIPLAAFAMMMGPVAVVGSALTTFGLFRLLFSLEPELVAATAAGLAPAPTPPGLPVPAAKSIAEAREQLAARPEDPALHQQLFNLLLADASAGEALVAHARDYVALLVRQSRADHAFGILKACLGRDPAFKPHPDHVLPLANIAQARGDGMTALRLMHEFDKRHPNHPAIAGVYYLSARVLRSQNKFSPAVKILDLLLQRFPDDPLARQARSLREALERQAVAPK